MCTIAILVNACDAPLVLAANRDELYARASRPPERLAPGLAGGVDAVGGGTWLALRADGVFAAVTNQPGAVAPPGARSRGLVVRELAASADLDAYVAALDPRGYASMNLAWGDAHGVRVAYLRTTGERDIVRLPDGIHVLCNDRLECAFARGVRLRAGIAGALARSGRVDDLVAALPAMLADHTADSSPLDATCIHTPRYGTRSSTIAVIDRRPATVRAAARSGGAGPFEPGRVALYLHADGPPCTTTFVDKLGLLQ
jgi:uncharacterized protein with NRDE domain